jgi:hypothetical protein
MGGYLPLAPGVSTVRYPIPQRTFKYVATVQSLTDETCQQRKSPRRDFQFQIGRAGDLTCVMATPEIASSPPTINFGVIRSPRNNTLEIKANTGSSRHGAMRPMEQRAISQNRAEDLVHMD